MYVEKFSPKVFVFLIIIQVLYLTCCTHGQNNKEIYKSKLPSNKLIRHRRHKMLQMEEMSDETLLLLDTSCISRGFLKAPNIDNGRVVRYSQKSVPYKNPTEDSGTDKKFLIATYSCSVGYSFETGGPSKMYCSDRAWIGTRPICTKSGSDIKPIQAPKSIGGKCPSEYSKNCEHDCVLERGQLKCICHEGFYMVHNKCLDVNECKEIENIQEICKYGCINTHGSYYCIKESIYDGHRPVKVEQSTTIRNSVNEDENGSGSGDYSERDYPDSNYENEDDEDYNQHKIKQTQVTAVEIEKTKAKDNSFEFENAKESHPSFDTVTTDEKIHVTTEMYINKEVTESAVVKGETKIGTKEESDYYYEEYDYKENDKKLENSLTKTDYREVDGNKFTAQSSPVEESKTVLFTTSKPQHETSTFFLKGVTDDNIKEFTSSETPIVRNRQPLIKTTIQTATKFEEAVIRTDNREVAESNTATIIPSPIVTTRNKEEEKLPVNKSHNQQGMKNEYEGNYDYYGETDYNRPNNTSTKISPTEVYHGTTEQYKDRNEEIKTTSSELPFETVTYPRIESRPEVVTIYEEENFVEERTIPQVVDDYDYELLTTTLKTPKLNFETTIFKEVVETTPPIESDLNTITKVASVDEDGLSEEHKVLLLTTPSSTINMENHHEENGEYDKKKKEERVKIKITKAPHGVSLVTSPPPVSPNKTEVYENRVGVDYDGEEKDTKEKGNTTKDSYNNNQAPTYTNEEKNKYNEDSNRTYYKEEELNVNGKDKNEDYKEEDYSEEEYKEDEYHEKITQAPNKLFLVPSSTSSPTAHTSITKENDYGEEEYEEEEYDDKVTQTPNISFFVPSSTSLPTTHASIAKENDYRRKEEYDEKITQAPDVSFFVPSSTSSSTTHTSITKENDYGEEQYEEEEYDDKVTQTPNISFFVPSSTSLPTTHASIAKENDYRRKEEYDEKITQAPDVSFFVPSSTSSSTTHTFITKENDYGEEEYEEEEYGEKITQAQNVSFFVPSSTSSPTTHNSITKENDYSEEEYEEEEYDDYKETNNRSQTTPTEDRHLDKENSSNKYDSTKTNESHRSRALECSLGFTLDNSGNCVDVDECFEKSANCSHDCENTLGSYRCLCPLGHIPSVQNPQVCVDLDECLKQPCSHVCVNKIGSFHCQCPPNHHLFNQTTCLEINCSHDHIVTSLGIECLCPLGFYLKDDDYTCEDFDECEDKQINNCFQSCENTYGSYKCSCKDGYRLMSDGFTCRETDNCKTNSCDHICNNNLDSYACSCFNGYYLLEDGRSCVDINECEGLNNCSQICFNNKGGFECDCFDGFILANDSVNCEDIDECILARNGGCSHSCVNSRGSYYCECPNHLHLADDQRTCLMRDPCAIENGGCSDICLNDNGKVVCSCPENYELINKTCIFINHCEVNNGGCSHTCEITAGNVECSCPVTHILTDGKTCKEVDLCANNNGGCSHGCTTFEGQALCSCPAGHDLKDSNCVRTNLCEINNGNCTHECSFVDDSIYCSCPTNYKLINETHCIKVKSCFFNNGGCSHQCEDTDDEVVCKCPTNHKLIDEKTCSENDPCLIDNGGCSHECLYNDKKVTCLCPSGYNLIGKSCHPTDPCHFRNGGCSHICENINGEAFCRCPSGFILIDRHCFELNPCSINNGGCSHYCTNQNGLVKCSCPSGYILDESRCLKQDPCSVNNGGCSHLCNFTRGIQTCSCPPGYILRPNKKLCKEINECKTKNGGCSHRCRNLPGSYECTCPDGYILEQNNRTCLDVDECSKNNGRCQQTCINYQGGFVCQCKEGYLLQNDRRTCRAKFSANCYVPQAPNHGRIRCLQMDINNGSHVPVGTQCIAWCDYGYKVRGRTLTTCNSLGNWDTQIPHCDPISCPKLDNVPNGYFTPNTCATGNLYPGEVCTLNCDSGHKPFQDLKTLTCLGNLQWSSSVSESSLSKACTRDSPVPFIKCPHSGLLSFTLPKGRNTMLITIPKPQTNVDWWQYVSSKPSWGMRLQNYLSAGRTDVIYSAHSPSTNSTVSCRLIVNVVDKEVPEVVNCPNNVEYKLGVHEYSRAVSWTEPTFEDNVGVVGVYKSREPGTRFRRGTHHVYYVARDESGNQAKCQFTIAIKGNDGKENQFRVYRSLLICPHGIQYIDKPLEEYDNEALKRQGCHWNQVRTKTPVNQRSYRAHNYKSGQEDEPSKNSNARYRPFSLYNKCC